MFESDDDLEEAVVYGSRAGLLPAELRRRLSDADLEAFTLEVVDRKIAEAIVLLEKQLDYGPHNIGRPPSGITPEVALIVRMNDKLQRAGNLTATGRDPAVAESLSDTAGDFANYGTIFGMVLDGVWPD